LESVTFIIQFLLFSLSGYAIYLTQHKDKRKNKQACLYGLASQPFWWYSAIVNQQWGILALNIYCTYSWLTGLYNNYIIIYKWYFEWFPPNQKDFGYYSDWYDIKYHGFSVKLFSVSWHLK
jgi:hypothetical protein